jgi:hypothetical protein
MTVSLVLSLPLKVHVVQRPRPWESASWSLNRPTKFPPSPPGWYDELNGKMGDDAVTNLLFVQNASQVLIASHAGHLCSPSQGSSAMQSMSDLR